MKAAKAMKGEKKHPALLHLRKTDPILYHASLPFAAELLIKKGHRRSYQQLFDSLAGAIVSQQLSTKASDTIWGRLKAACGGQVTPEALSRLRTPSMRKAGLSAAKTKSLKELSRAVLKNEINLEALRKIPEEEAIVQLTAVWGIGRWTAEMFLMFALNREDVFSPGDLGLRRSMEHLYNLKKDTPIKKLETIASNWSPHRTFACRVLWKLRDQP